MQKAKASVYVARPSNKYVNDAFKYGKAREGEAWWAESKGYSRVAWSFIPLFM